MTRLDPSAVDLLDAARNANDPTADDRAATRALLERKIGAAAFILPAAVAPGASAAAAKALGAAGTRAAATGIAKGAVGGALVAKPVAIAVGVAVAASATWGVVEVRRAPEPEPAAHVAAWTAPKPAAPSMMRRAPSPVALPAPEPPAAPAREPAPEAIPAPADPAPVVARASIVPTNAAPAPRPLPIRPVEGAAAPRVAPPPPRGDLGEEARLLQQAFAAIEGQPARALDLLDQYAIRFPRGSMIAEGSVERVLALCAAGRVDDARREARRYHVDFPDGPMSDRVAASCAGDK